MGLELSILPPAQLRFWQERPKIPSGFVLYGGTAIALRLGHRSSQDFDFFSSHSFEPAQLLSNLSFAGEAVVLQKARETLTLQIDRSGPVKLSFFGGLTFGQAVPPDEVAEQNFSIASLPDLMAAKLKVLWQRAEAKDYLDVAVLIRAGVSLEYGLGCASAIYGETFNPAIVLKALTFFEDGDLPALDPSVRELLIKEAASVRDIPEVRQAAPRLGPAKNSK